MFSIAQLREAAIIFDLDGTLVDTAGDLALATNAALVAEGFKPTTEEAVRDLIGEGARAMIARGLALSGVNARDERQLDRCLTIFLRHYANNIADRSRPFPGVMEMISQARAAGAKIAICTNKTEALAKRLITELRIAESFDIIVGGDTADAPKPDAAPLNLCLNTLRRKRAVLIGDSDTDIMAAENAGLPCVLFMGGYGPGALRAREFDVISRYDEDACALIRKALG